MENYRAHILIVDDEKFNLQILEEYLSNDYQVSTAEDGFIAWQMLEHNPQVYDVILLDRMMPAMDGIEVLEKIKQHPTLKHCPVIFQTARSAESEILEGLKAGAYYYLTKPYSEEVLLSVIRTAVKECLAYKELQLQLQQTHITMGKLNHAIFEFQTLEQARSIGSLLSNACPEPDKIVMGLTELMINAVEHGNLGISYEEKTVLNNNGRWIDEVNSRLAMPEHQDKKVLIEFQRFSDRAEITITDQGNGFDHENYMDFDPTRIMDNHGRGIAIANKLSFSAVEYSGNGNQVKATLELVQ